MNTAAATTTTATTTQIHQVDEPPSDSAALAAGARLGASLVAAVVVTPAAGAPLGATLMGVFDGPGFKVTSGAGLSGSGWPGSWISIHREMSPFPYVSRVLNDSRVCPSGSFAILTFHSASVPILSALPATVKPSG